MVRVEAVVPEAIQADPMGVDTEATVTVSEQEPCSLGWQRLCSLAPVVRQISLPCSMSRRSIADHDRGLPPPAEALRAPDGPMASSSSSSSAPVARSGRNDASKMRDAYTQVECLSVEEMTVDGLKMGCAQYDLSKKGLRSEIAVRVFMEAERRSGGRCGIERE